MAATWKVTQKKNTYSASYSGDLHEALEKAKADLKKYLHDEDIPKWVWINMAYTLAAVHKKKVLVIDNDKQGNASKAFDRYDTEDKNTIARAMLERNLDVSEIIKKTNYEGIDIITANMDLLEANLRTVVDTGRQQQTRFKKALAAVAGNYDFCIIDNAPDINMSIINALVTSNDVIMPIFMDQYSFDGLNILLEQIGQVQEDFNEALNFAGCLVTQYQNNDVNNSNIEKLQARGLPMYAQKIRRTEKKVYEGQLLETEYIKRGGAIWQQIRVDGKITSENRVYKVNSDKPYTRGFGRYWYLDDEAKEAMQAVL